MQNWLFNISWEISLPLMAFAYELLLVSRLIALHVFLECLLFVRIFLKELFLGVADCVSHFIPVLFIVTKES